MMIFLLLLLAFPTLSHAACTGSSPTWTITAWADFQGCVNGATSGDTINLSSGAYTANSQVAISKALTLVGAGVGSTVITVTHTGSPVLDITLEANKTTRLTATEWTGATVEATYSMISVEGCSTDNRRIRIDNNKFNKLRRSVLEMQTALGVVDHNEFIDPDEGQPAYLSQNKGLSWGTGSCGSNTFGDGSWAEADNFGTDKFTFYEDNTYTTAYAGHHTIMDNHGGGRYVVRSNSFQRGNLETHGQEASRNRGGRAFEIYNNTFTGNDSSSNVIYMRGGVGVVYNNAVYGYQTTSAGLSLLDNRTRDTLGDPFAGADGRNIWDVNSGSNPFVTGNVSSAGTLTMTDSEKSWTTDQWRGYTVRKTSGKSCSSLTRSGATATAVCTGHGFSTSDRVTIFGANEIGYNNLFAITVVDPDTFTFTINTTPTSPATGTIKAVKGSAFSIITANTATRLTFADSIYGSIATLVFATNDTYEINKVTHTMDGVGRSQGSALNGQFTPTLPSGWNDQTTTGWWEWSNTICNSSPPTVGCAGSNLNFDVSSAAGLTFVSGTHYTNDTQKSGYTAYCYPHPLVSGTPCEGGGGGGDGSNRRFAPALNLRRADAGDVAMVTE